MRHLAIVSENEGFRVNA